MATGNTKDEHLIQWVVQVSTKREIEDNANKRKIGLDDTVWSEIFISIEMFEARCPDMLKALFNANYARNLEISEDEFEFCGCVSFAKQDLFNIFKQADSAELDENGNMVCLIDIVKNPSIKLMKYSEYLHKTVRVEAIYFTEIPKNLYDEWNTPT
jgi:hypothetical protein